MAVVARRGSNGREAGKAVRSYQSKTAQRTLSQSPVGTLPFPHDPSRGFTAATLICKNLAVECQLYIWYQGFDDFLFCSMGESSVAISKIYDQYSYQFRPIVSSKPVK